MKVTFISAIALSPMEAERSRSGPTKSPLSQELPQRAAGNQTARTTISPALRAGRQGQAKPSDILSDFGE